MELAWRAEEACMNAWPSPRQVMLEGWLLRAAGGGTRRTNSVNPLRGSGDPRKLLPVAEAIYGALGRSALFRVPSLVDGLDAVLDAAGYAPEGRTLTLFNDFSNLRGLGSAVEVAAAPGEEWLQARTRLNGVDAVEARIYETMLGCIVPPKAFAALRDDGEIAAIAYCVVCDGLAVIESVVTDPARRQRGFGCRTVGALLDWARRSGARAACLQVVADNAPALALYHSLGFDRELYQYHYRRKPAAPS